MANNNFNTRDFLSGAFFAPIALGEHKVTFGKVKTVLEENNAGEDASYILAPITFENGREVSVRFYSFGAQIFCNQTRQQLNDVADYKSVGQYLKTLEGKEVSVWVSKRTYTSKDGMVKTTLQYDFTEPAADTAGEVEEIF